MKHIFKVAVLSLAVVATNANVNYLGDFTGKAYNFTNGALDLTSGAISGGAHYTGKAVALPGNIASWTVDNVLTKKNVKAVLVLATILAAIEAGDYYNLYNLPVGYSLENLVEKIGNIESPYNIKRIGFNPNDFCSVTQQYCLNQQKNIDKPITLIASSKMKTTIKEAALYIFQYAKKVLVNP